jgi:DNA-binding transcriptional MocR family regulator
MPTTPRKAASQRTNAKPARGLTPATSSGLPSQALTRGADTTLTEQLARRFAEQIQQRLLSPGSRLPSVRECARRQQVSPSTVVAAYDRLLAQGLVEARKQRGFFVREPAQRRAQGTQATLPTAARPRAILSATSLMRGMFQPPGSLPMPGLGTLPVDWLDVVLLSTALKRVSSGAALAPLALQYGESAGDPRLRLALSRKVQDFGISAAPEQMITTLGATQALDVITRSLLRAGDTVLVDEPGWPVEFARLAALGLRVLPVPRGENGPDLAVMERLIKAQAPHERPRLYITVSVLHNPTGSCLSLQSAHQLLQLANKHDLHILEDDSYCYLAPAHLPRLAALDGLQRTIYVSGFSKILVPNWRVGYIAAPPNLVDRFIDTKLLTTLTTPSLTEQALAYCLEQGLLRRHADRVNQKLDAARSRSVKLALAHGCEFKATPRGLFGWVDVGVDTERLAHAMLDEGWLLAPGSIFYASHRPTTLMRVNFSTTQDARFWGAVARARRRSN